jgi:hypothetical protein
MSDIDTAVPATPESGIDAATTVVKFTHRAWNTTRKAKDADKAVIEKFRNQEGSSTVSKDLLGGKNTRGGALVREINNIDGTSRNYHYANTVPLLGARSLGVLPNSRFAEFVEWFSERKSQVWYPKVQEFLHVYDELYAELEVQGFSELADGLGLLFDPSQYPTPEVMRGYPDPVRVEALKVQGKTLEEAHDIAFAEEASDPFYTKEQLRRSGMFRFGLEGPMRLGSMMEARSNPILNIERDAAEALRDQMVAAHQGMVNGVVEDVYAVAVDRLTHLGERLDYSDDDQKKVFRSSITSNLETALKLFDALPATDTKSQRIKRDIQDLLQTIGEPEALRHSETLRVTTKAKVDTILKDLTVFDI